jgi:cytochrome c nitrite reductase small subunit
MLYVCKIGLGVIFITPEFEIMSFFCKKVYYMMLSKRQKMITALIAGVVAGGGLYFLYLLRAHTYLTDEPSACVNCHIMSPYYATWMHSSHSRNATCNDCHVPHENFVKKWTFKGMDGVKHVAAFLTSSEPQVIQAHPASSQVIMNNCIRCHEQLNTELVKTGRIDYMMSEVELIIIDEISSFSNTGKSIGS